MRFNARIEGINELNESLKILPIKMRRNLYYKALAKGSTAIKLIAERNVKAVTSSEASGYLAKNIRVYRLKKKRGWYRSGVMIRRKAVNKRKRDGKGQPVRVGLYGSVLEFGKSNQIPRPWLRTAKETGELTARSEITRYIKSNLPKLINESRRG